MDVSSLSAARHYASARPATEPGGQSSSSFGLASAMAQDFAATMARGETQAMQSMTGDADPHSLVLALAQTELAVETVVTVRNKVVEAYQEILRMPV